MIIYARKRVESMEPIRIVTPPLMANAYLLLDERPSLIDCGGDSSFIFGALKKHMNPKDLEFLFLTHSHFDHAMASVDLKRWFNCKVVMHEREFELLRSGYSLFGHRFYVEPDILVRGGEVFDLGEIELEVIHTPGHTPGSVCYYEPKRRWLFSGDTVFAHGAFGRVDLPGGNAFELIESLKKLAEMDVERLYPGHEDVVEENAREHILRALEIAKLYL